jgi:hypothetical protein
MCIALPPASSGEDPGDRLRLVSNLWRNFENTSLGLPFAEFLNGVLERRLRS